jgi:hypothetical protein
VREIALLGSLFIAYRLGRLAIAGHDDLALANAWHVWDVERVLHLPDEENLQSWLLQWPSVLKAANWFYVTVHFPVTLAFLAWGWLRRPPEEYRWARRLIITLTAFAMVLHTAMPLAPPRMLSSLGFVDTMAVFGPSAYDGHRRQSVRGDAKPARGLGTAGGRGRDPDRPQPLALGRHRASGADDSGRRRHREPLLGRRPRRAAAPRLRAAHHAAAGRRAPVAHLAMAHRRREPATCSGAADEEHRRRGRALRPR